VVIILIWHIGYICGSTMNWLLIVTWPAYISIPTAFIACFRYVVFFDVCLVRFFGQWWARCDVIFFSNSYNPFVNQPLLLFHAFFKYIVPITTLKVLPTMNQHFTLWMCNNQI
jgi:hypothetical protein